MLALAGANGVGVLLFATLYALAGARVLPQAAFLACLLLVFGLVTALWVRVEARHRPLGGVRRLGRIVIGLAVVAIATPVITLTPLSWLESRLPPEAGLATVLPGIMALVLIALVLVLAVNVVGGAIAVGLTVSRRRRG